MDSWNGSVLNAACGIPMIFTEFLHELSLRLDFEEEEATR
jgi:hypothetical protein